MRQRHFGLAEEEGEEVEVSFKLVNVQICGVLSSITKGLVAFHGKW